jgi:hypothetical protein
MSPGGKLEYSLLYSFSKTIIKADSRAIPAAIGFSVLSEIVKFILLRKSRNSICYH